MRATRLRIAVIGTLTLLVGCPALTGCGGGGDDGAATSVAVPANPPGQGSGKQQAKAPRRIVSAAEVGELASQLGQPVYWAGSIPGTELEVSELAEGGVQVAYQPAGTAAGKGSSAVLTIGSYPLADPRGAVEGYAGRAGSIVQRGKDGTEVVSSRSHPTSAYFASPDNSVQVEVYDPSSRRAMKLALSGVVRPAE